MFSLPIKNKFIFVASFKTFSTKIKMDPYLILEINRNSDWPAIKKAYFRLARLYHPDLNKNDEVIIN
jgi:DnaJ-class molecular chaperone